MSFCAPERTRAGPLLPMSAMVDILFLLLIFFITTASFQEQEKQIDVDVPVYESPAHASGKTQTVIAVKEGGVVIMGGEEFNLGTDGEKDRFHQKLVGLHTLYPEESILVRGDKETRYGIVIRVIDLVRDAKFTNVSQAVKMPQRDVP